MLFIFISFGQPEKWHISITTRNLKEHTVIGNGMYSAIGFPASCFPFHASVWRCPLPLGTKG